MFVKLAIRDAVVVIVAMGLWLWLSAFSLGMGMLSDFTGVVAGVALAACAYIFHEWGHLMGAFAAGGVVHPPASLKSAYIFSFDRKKNTRGQFLVMSAGGFIATGVALWAVYTFIPDDELASRVARGGVLFLVFLGVSLELPLVGWSLLSSELPPIEVFPHPDDEAKPASAQDTAN